MTADYVGRKDFVRTADVVSRQDSDSGLTKSFLPAAFLRHPSRDQTEFPRDRRPSCEHPDLTRHAHAASKYHTLILEMRRTLRDVTAFDGIRS